MNDPAQQDDDPDAAAGLMSVAREKRSRWAAGELESLWRHQLRTPLPVDPSELVRDASATVAGLSLVADPRLDTFGDLLRHPSPPIHLVLRAKEFAKEQRGEEEGLLIPPELATVLYYAAIAAGLARCGQRITELKDAPLRRGLEWAAGQPWIDAHTRALLRDAIRHVG